MIKTFRAKVAEDQQVKIPLSGGDTNTGYRIVELTGMPADTAGATNTSNEALVCVWKNRQSNFDSEVDFNDDNLLAAFYFLRDQGVVAITSESVIFDDELINQDIFVTYVDAQTNNVGFNWFLKIEEVKMKDPEIAVVNYKAALLHGE
tara:strand:- start:694 stop:1137 length:444 start_codon:yes stop_codon:yes gene_type:complete